MVAEKTKDDLLRRLRKVKGQISGLERMIEEDASCSNILIQVSAVRAAIGKIGMLIMQNYMRDCFSCQDEKTFEERVEELVSSFSKFIR